MRQWSKKSAELKKKKKKRHGVKYFCMFTSKYTFWGLQIYLYVCVCVSMYMHMYTFIYTYMYLNEADPGPEIIKVKREHACKL